MNLNISLSLSLCVCADTHCLLLSSFLAIFRLFLFCVLKFIGGITSKSSLGEFTLFPHSFSRWWQQTPMYAIFAEEYTFTYSLHNIFKMTIKKPYIFSLCLIVVVKCKIYVLIKFTCRMFSCFPFHLYQLLVQ